jgi:uncharacterized protein (DUF58 family)
MAQQINAHGLVDPEVLSRLARLNLCVRKPVNGNYTGLHKSLVKGASSEFSQYRNYAKGDDISLIDWKIYGRSDRFYIKEFDADTNLRLTILLDTSASMNFRSSGKSKFETAIQIASAFAHVGIRQSDAVGLQTFSSESNAFIPAKTNPKHLQIINTQLKNTHAHGESNIAHTLNDIASKIPKRGLVIVLSDLFEDPEQVISGLKHLVFKKHDVAVFHFLDELELNFDITEPTTFVDSEGNKQISADPNLIREKYLMYLDEYLLKMKEESLSSGIDYHMVESNANVEELLANFMLSRIHT